MSHILAIDTGGTKSQAILLTEVGALVGAGYCEGRSVDGAKSAFGSGRSAKTIANAARQALNGKSIDNLVVANTSATPFDVEEIGDKIEARMVLNESDCALALADEETGVVVLAGTGAMAFGRTTDCRSLHMDALGPLLGDYGSAYYIGNLALRAAARSEWHPRHNTSLGAAVRQTLGCRQEDPTGGGLLSFALGHWDRADIAELSKLVGKAATEGDTIAVSILQDAAASLAATVHDVTDRLGISDCAYALVGTGGMLTHCPLYWQLLCGEVAKFAPNLRPIISPLPPVVGVAIHALKARFGQDWRSRAETLRQAATEWFVPDKCQ